MSGLVKLSLAALLLAVAVFGFLQAGGTKQASRPADMPADAQFLASGYDLGRNEARGTWVVCRFDPGQGTDWCRITDQDGRVVYQGAYVPAGSLTAEGPSRLTVASGDPARLWVSSPETHTPEPVLPLTDGEILVPAADAYALTERWKTRPRELTRLLGSGS